jgi:ribose-phosphate pyrophosphokinase
MATRDESHSVIFSGSAAAKLGGAVALALGAPLGRAELRRFPDGELHLAVDEKLENTEAVLVQSLLAPAGENLLELLLLADACRRASARSLTAVVPYLAYARQDRALRAGEALSGPLFARLLSAGRFDRVVAVELHAAAAQGWFDAPLFHLSGVELLAEALRGRVAPNAVVVSPDLGGAKRADRLARLLGLPMAIVHKTRRDGDSVTVHAVLGQVQGRAAVIADDLIATGATIEAAAQALRIAGCIDDLTVVVTHPVLANDAAERLGACGIRRLLCTDSVPLPKTLPFDVTVVSLAPMIATELLRSSRQRG